MSNDFKKRGLGRGLGALIMNTDTEPASEEMALAASAGSLVPVTALSPNPRQPRSNFDDTTLQELADSIRAHGIIQPLVVSADSTRAGTYWIVAGERRWRAAQLAGLQVVPVVVREASPQQLLEWALVENVQRDDLDPLEEAAAYHALLEQFGLTQAEVAERVGKSRSAVANTLRLRNLPAEAQQAIVDGHIAAGHARALLALPDTPSIRRALAKVLQRDLSVRQTEALVKQMLQPPPAAATEPEPGIDPAAQAQLSDLEKRFRTAFGTKVSLNRNQDGSGRLVVHFYSDEDLAAIYRLIAGEDTQ